MIMQHQSSEELCNLLVQSLLAKDEKLMQKVLEQEDPDVIKDIISRVPVNHVRKLVLELGNILSTKLSTNHLQWLQHLLALKYSYITSMADGRSILIPLISLLEDRSTPAYRNKMQTLKGKLMLLRQLRETRQADRVETCVRVQAEPDQSAQMEIDSDTDTEEEIDDNDLVDESDGNDHDSDGKDAIDDDDEEEDDEGVNDEDLRV